MKAFSVTVTSKGQFTLPREVREKMGIAPGDRMELFVTRQGETILRPLTKPASAIFGRGRGYAGTAKGDPMDAITEEIATKGRQTRTRKAG